MKKIINTLYIIAFAISCSGDQSLTTSDLIKAKDLNGLKTQKEQKLKILNAMKAELNQINDAISDLDPSEKLALISIFEVKPENFDHHIEIQANIKTRQNVLLYPEYTGTLKKIYVEEGQEVKKGKLLAQIEDARLKNQLEQLQIQTALSKTTYERTQKLWDQNIVLKCSYFKPKRPMKVN